MKCNSNPVLKELILPHQVDITFQFTVYVAVVLRKCQLQKSIPLTSTSLIHYKLCSSIISQYNYYPNQQYTGGADKYRATLPLSVALPYMEDTVVQVVRSNNQTF